MRRSTIVAGSALAVGLLTLGLLAGGTPSPSRQDRAAPLTTGAAGPSAAPTVTSSTLPETAVGAAATPDPVTTPNRAAPAPTPVRPPAPARAPTGGATSSLTAAWAAAGARVDPGAEGGGPAGPAPVRIEIPAIGVAAPVDPIGLQGDGSLEVPTDFGRIGWYTGRPAPGDVGPAIVVGHVDSRRGPAVFYRLRELAAGAEVVVHRADGSRVVFTVHGSARHPKSEFPTDAVYGPTPERALRLITCGGSFDHSSRHYRDNVIVFARTGG